MPLDFRPYKGMGLLGLATPKYTILFQVISQYDKIIKKQKKVFQKAEK